MQKKNKYMGIVVFVVIVLGFIIGLILIVSTDNDEEHRGKKEMIDTILENLKYSASPRLSIKYCKQALEIDPDNA